MNRWQRFKAWAKRTWKKFTAWISGLFAVLVGAVIVGQSFDVSYTPAVEYVDGNLMPIDEIAETRLYCNDELLVSEPGADGLFENALSSLPVGDYVCYGTHLAINGLESGPSNTVTYTVRPNVAPRPPELVP